MKFLITVSLSYIFISTMAQIREMPITGLAKPTAEELRMLPHSAAAMVSSNVVLPDSVDLSSNMPPCGNQGKQGSCATFSAVYACLSYLENLKYQKDFLKNGKLDSTSVYSPKFIYNLIINERLPKDIDCKQGLKFTTVLNKLREQGAPTLRDLPYQYSDPNDCLKPLPEESVFFNASKHRIVDYEALYLNDAQEIQSRIARKLPVMFAMNIDSSLVLDGYEAANQHKDFIYKYKPEKSYAYHAMVCTGYNKVTGLFKVLNCWGKDWGNNGYFYIPFDEFVKNVAEKYVAYAGTTTAIPFDNLTKSNDRRLQFDKNGSFSGWFRLGYFKLIDHLSVGVNYVNKNKEEVIVSILDGDDTKPMATMILFKNQTKYFYYEGKKINITFNKIDLDGKSSFVNDVSLYLKLSDHQHDPIVTQLLNRLD